MRTFLLLVTALAAAASPALADGPSRLSLTLSGGSSTPSIDASGAGLGLGNGYALGASLGFDLAPALRATAGGSWNRFPSGNSLAMIPELFVREARPVDVTTAMAGLEVHAGLPRTPFASVYLGGSAGRAWLAGGQFRFDDMNGPSFTTPGVSESAPAFGADAGLRISSRSRLALDLGWGMLAVHSAHNPITTSGLRLGVSL